VHEGQTTTVCAFEKTVVMAKHPGHLTSGFRTLRLSLCVVGVKEIDGESHCDRMLRTFLVVGCFVWIH